MDRWFTLARMRIHVAEDGQSVVEAWAPHGDMPPLHLHQYEDETFYVLEGRLSLYTGESSYDLGPGEAAFAPHGVPHAYRVESAEGARWLVVTNSGGFATFVEAASVPAAADGYPPAESMLAPEVLAAEAAACGIELLGPPGLLPQEAGERAAPVG